MNQSVPVRIAKTFLAGAAVGVPMIITLVVIWRAGVWLDGLAVGLVGGLSASAGEWMADVPGLGIILILALIFLLGLAARFWLTARLLGLLEWVLERVPVVKSVYTAVRDMLRFFGGDSGAMGKVVLYTPAGSSFSMLAILTNRHPVGLPAERAEGMVAIWLPMSYNLGGYMLYVPLETVRPIEMSVEQVMKLTATAEVGAEPRTAPPRG